MDEILVLRQAFLTAAEQAYEARWRAHELKLVLRGEEDQEMALAGSCATHSEACPCPTNIALARAASAWRAARHEKVAAEDAADRVFVLWKLAAEFAPR